MLQLLHNTSNISKLQLIEIEESFKQSLLVENNTPELNVLLKNRTDLLAHVLSIFFRLNIHKILGLDVSQMLDFLIDVAEKYTEAPYHTFYHAVDIVTMLYYLCHDLNADKYLNSLDLAFLMVAALCHDIGHPGFNNAFQIKTKTDLAQKYGERSTLESYSVDLTVQLLNKHNINNRGVEMNETIKDLILSTDMEYHADLVKQANRLKKVINEQSITYSNKRKHSTLSQHVLDNIKDRMSLCRILLHAADISNMARPWLISKQWSDLIVQEFFSQGDKEKNLKISISPGMDREVCSQQSISLKFGEIILPYFECLVGLLPKSHVLVDYLAANRVQWECLEPNTNRIELPKIRRVSSYIQSPTWPVPLTTSTTIKYKRIRLGFRSQSYPTVLYHHREHNVIIEKNNLLPLVNFKPPSLYDTSSKTNIESAIVLYHPYDQ